jgi:P27 family predicted phage terminase small subunit
MGDKTASKRGTSMPGPKPTPTHLKLLRGNPGKRPIHPEPEPEISPAVPEPPPFLTGYAVDEWRRVAPVLYRLSLLTLADLMPFAAYCQAYSRWRTAEEALADMATGDEETKGLLVERADGKEEQNPLVRITSNAARDMVRYAAEFGMTPSARSRVRAGTGGRDSKFDGLIA